MTATAARQVPVIAVGSSANGVKALRELVSALPAGLPAAVRLADPSTEHRETDPTRT